MSILDNYNVNFNKLFRDYEKYPLKLGCNQYTSKAEKPYKKDLEYLYIELNIPRKVLCKYFNCGVTKWKKWINEYKIKKSHLAIRFNKYHLPIQVLNLLLNKNSLKKYILDNNIETYKELSVKLNVSQTLISKYIKIHNLNNYFKKGKSFEEKELQDYISSFIEIKRNDRELLKPYELDIFIPSKNIGIEFMGKYWHNYNIFPKKLISDIKKYKIAKQYGIKIIYVWENDWLKSKNIIKKIIYDYIMNK